MIEYTIDYCIRKCLSDIGETSMRYYQPFFNWAVQGYRRLNLAGLLETNKSVMLNIDPNTHCAQLPDDYVDFLKVGICSNGHVINFTYNENICNQVQLGNQETCDCNADQIAQDLTNIGCGCTTGMTQWWYYPYWYDGLWYGGLYGYSGVNYRGGYKIIGDKICFDSNINLEKCLLEYKSNGLAGAGTIVTEGAIDVITSYIHLQRVTFDKDRNTRLDIVPFQKAYNTAVIGFRARKAAITAHDWRNYYLQSFQQSVKR